MWEGYPPRYPRYRVSIHTEQVSTAPPMMIEEQSVTAEDVAATRFQLAKIMGSSPFVRSNRIGEFLTFVIENTIEGNYDVLKETCIGSMVFGRDLTYDPKIDPIVRVEARRLRSKLREYYETEGTADTIFITLPKGGYRPLIETRVIESPPIPQTVVTSQPAISHAEPVATSLSPAKSTPPANTPRRRLFFALFAANLVLLAIAIFWFVQRQHPTFREARPAALTSYVGQEFDPALSPDGKHIAFVWDGDSSNYDIYVKPVPTGDPVRLTTSPAHDLHPAWSPDGRDLAFLRVTPSGSQVVIIPATGGPERTLGELHNNVSLWKADASQIIGSLGPSWSPDGESIIVNNGGALYLWPLAFGAHRQLTSPLATNNDFFPAVSPDGTAIAFVRQTSNSTADLYLSTLHNASTPRRLTSDKSDIRGITWAPDGRSIIFSSQREGSYTLWQLFTDDGRIEAIPTNSMQAAGPSLAREGTLLAYTELTQNTNIWRMSLADSRTGSSSAVRLIASSRRNNSPQYSSDGQQIAFVSDRSGNWELWACHADGTSPRQLTNFRGPLVGTPHWSPDGKWIAFDVRPGEHSAIFIVPGSGGTPQQLSHNTFEERMPNWSADGHFLYFSSTRSGAVRLWRMTATGDSPTQITDRPAYDSFEADAGHTLYFRSDGSGVWSVPTTGGTATQVSALADIEPSRYLAVTSHALYFVDRESTPRHIKAYNFSTHKITTIGEIEHTLVSGTPSLSVSPDERFILYAQQDQSSSDILAIPWRNHR